MNTGEILTLKDNLPVLIVVFPFLFAFFTGIFGSFKRFICFPLALIGVICSLISSLFGFCLVYNQRKDIVYTLGGWTRDIGISFYLNSYNASLLFLINLSILFVLLYSRRVIILKFPDRLYAFYSLILLFLTGILGIVITGDAFNLYVFLEIVSLSSYAMIALNGKESYVAALRYLIIGTVGATFYLLGVGILYLKTGNLNMSEIHNAIISQTNLLSIKAAFLFITIGFSIKFAFFPFHSWLPFAYSKTINTVSAVMAPIVTKVTIFALIKVIVLVFGLSYVFSFTCLKFLFSSVLAPIGMIYFSLKAFSQKNISLSFCYILLMECSLMFGALFLNNILSYQITMYHIALDIIMTLSLFLFVGVLETYFRVYNFSDLESVNIFKLNPTFCILFFITCLSVLGIPPTGGFFSKFYIILAAFTAHVYFFPVCLIVSSFIILVVFLRIFEKLYFNTKKAIEGANNKVPVIMLLIFFVNAFLILGFGFNFNLILKKIISLYF